MRVISIVGTVLVAGLLAACGGSPQDQAAGLVGAEPASSTPPASAESTPTETPTPTATPSPTKAAVVAPAVTKKSTPAPTKKSTPAPTKTKAAAKTDPDMGTCKAAKAAGYGPYYKGKDPEYYYYNDRDHDGVVCE